MNMDENRIPGNGQMSAEDQHMAELPPEIMEKANGGVLFPDGPTRCMFCGKLCNSPLRVCGAHCRGTRRQVIGINHGCEAAIRFRISNEHYMWITA